MVGFPIHYAHHRTLVGAAVVAGVGQGTLDLANMIATVTFQLPHSREEAEADRIGLELMARAADEPRVQPLYLAARPLKGAQACATAAATHPACCARAKIVGAPRRLIDSRCWSTESRTSRRLRRPLSARAARS